MKTVKKVFISYAWNTVEDANYALNLANYFRTEHGIDANIDQYVESPPEGWPRWMEKQITNSDYVLIVANKVYWDKLYLKSTGKGVTWETGIIYQYLYDAQGNNQRFIPVYFDKENIQYIPTPIKGATHYDIFDKQQLLKLCNRINGIQNTIKPPLGNRPLPAKERKHLFISSPINMDLWDEADWRGVAFLMDNPKNTNEFLLALQFNGDTQAVRKIFKEWQNYDKLDDYIDIKFIEGEIEGLPTGYTCLIQPNFNKSVERMIKGGADINDTLVMTISRFQRMQPTDNFFIFKKFKRYCKNNLPIKLIPISLKNMSMPFSDTNANIHFDCMVQTKNISYIEAKDIKKDSLEACILPENERNINDIIYGEKK